MHSHETKQTQMGYNNLMVYRHQRRRLIDCEEPNGPDVHCGNGGQHERLLC